MDASCLLALALCGFPYTRSQEETINFDFGHVTQKSTTTKVFYAPHPGLDPYWIGGEWVFGTTTTKGSTPSGGRVGNAHRVLVCGRPCARVYRKLKGEVCVHKLYNVYDPTFEGTLNSNMMGMIDWRLGGVLDRNHDYLRTWPSYCYFLDIQCRTNYAHGYGYAFLHMGACAKDWDAFPNLMRASDIKQRKRDALKRYDDQRNIKGCVDKGQSLTLGSERNATVSVALALIWKSDNDNYAIP